MQVPAHLEIRTPSLAREAGEGTLPAFAQCRLYLASELVARFGGKMTGRALLETARRAVEQAVGRTGTANIYFHAFEFRGERLALSSYLGRDGGLVVDVGPAPERLRREAIRGGSGGGSPLTPRPGPRYRRGPG